MTFVVWVPKLYGEASDVPTATRFVSDPRAQHFWDDSSVLVHQYDTVLGLGQDAWDVYMIYGPQAQWDGALPRLRFSGCINWISQLIPEPPAPT